MRKNAGFCAVKHNTVKSTVTADEELEREIDAAYHAMMTATSDDLRRAAFDVMRSLIAQRSPQRVLEMEHSQGLR